MKLTTVEIPDSARRSYTRDGLSAPWVWCLETFGRPCYGGRWHWDTHNSFFFDSEQDAVLFTLRFL